MKRFILISMVSLLMVSCVADNIDNNSTPRDTSSKIINTPNNADKTTLLVKLHGYTTDFCVEYEGASISTRPLIPAGRASEQKLQSEEIFHWWVLNFDESADVEAIAEAMARDERIAVVEYNSFVEPIASELSHEPMTMTRSDLRPTVEMPFNDPNLPYQWH